MTAHSDDEIGADLDIDAIEARAQAATSGPWYAYDNIGEGADAEFIAHARTDVHALVAEVRELLDSRERAIRWAVTLEGQNAAMEAALTEIEALAEKWRYKGEFGWGAWQEGHGPDEEGYILDQAAAEIRAALTGSTE